MLASFLTDVSDGDNIVPKRLAERLRMPMTRLSKLAHLNRNTVADRPTSPAVQRKLGEIARIIARVAAMNDDEGAAIIWFKYQPIVGFGGKTAQELVEQGHADAVMWHIESVENGGVA
jgi:uncharacterized protein (DUF2384 family)